MKTIFSTGQVAKICKVAPRTVSKWFDSGRLRGYRIPGSQDRRIPREHLISFLKENGMPLGEFEENGSVSVLCITGDESKMQEVFPPEHFRVSFFTEAFDLGIRVGALGGSLRICVVIDFDHLGEKGSVCAASLREFGVPPVIIGFGSPAVNHDGCDVFMRFPFEGPIFLAEAMRLLGLEVGLVTT